MANICTTQINIYANESTIDWFERLVKTYDEQDYIGQFGDLEAENMIDRIGSKWVYITENYRVDQHEYYIALESAWYMPDVLMKNIYTQLAENDPGAFLSGRFWDEAYSPIGIFEINSSGFHTAETDVEVDFDEEYYWDEQIEPAFNRLEL